MIEFSLASYDLASQAERADTAARVHEGLRSGEVLVIRDYGCDGVSEPQVRQNLALVREALQELEVDIGFTGIDGMQVVRRSCALINALGRPQIDEAYVSAQMRTSDGDPESLSRGLELLRSPEIRQAVDQNNRVMDRVIGAVMGLLQRSLRIPEGYLRDEVLAGSTYRQRLVYYDAAIGDSKCGVHPDGNLLSFLLTDTRGLRYFTADLEVREPEPEGILCMAGSLLWRWSGGLYPPIFHYVKQMSGESKTSIVYFYNLENGKSFQPVPFGERNEPYVNDIKRYKPEDVSPDGPFAALFERLTERATYD